MDEPTTATATERADAAERRMIVELDRVIAARSPIYVSGDRDPRERFPVSPNDPRWNGRRFLMGNDPRLPAMPKKPTLVDFFRYRFEPAAHLLQSARLARKAGHGEKVVLASLLHDISVIGFIRGDHGYWGAQLVEPYVDEEVSWAIRAHQVLRFFPDESVGYAYPELYLRLFGEDYQPEPYVLEAYNRYRKHKWYMTARLICLNDVYAFDPNVDVRLEEFIDVIERHFRQPAEGLGWDDSPSAHMWRTINWPTRLL
jgi:hypothetical protein